MQKRDEFGIGQVGAFMLIHLRAGTDIKEFKEEFRFIRHGHYDNLIAAVQKRFPNANFESKILVGYKAGVIKTSNFTQRNDGTFVGIMNSQKPMNEFAKLLLENYPKLSDPEFRFRTFQEVVLFELGIRNSLSNIYINNGWDHNLITDLKMELQQAIEELCDLKQFDTETREVLHSARQFRNYIKEKQLKQSYKFKSGAEGLAIFTKAIKLMQENEIGLYVD